MLHPAVLVNDSVGPPFTSSSSYHEPQSGLREPVGGVLQLGTGVAAHELPVEGGADEGREEAGSH